MTSSLIRRLAISVFLAVLVAAVLVAAQQALGLPWPGEAPRPGFLAAAAATHFMTLSFMAVRLKAAVGIRSLAGLLDMTVLHNFLLAFLPVRLADIYYPVLVAGRTQDGLGAGVGNLVLLRLLDLAAIAVILSLALPVVLAGAAALQAGGLAIFLAAFLAMLIVAVWRLAAVLGGVAGLIRKAARRRPPGTRPRRLFQVLARARHWVRGLDRRRRLLLFAVSLLIWMSSAATYFMVFRALGLDLSVARSVFAGQLTEMGGALPVQTVAGLGAGEGVLAAVLTAYGLGLGRAAVFALWCRLSLLLVVAFLFAGRSVLVLTVFKRGRAIDRPAAFEVLFGSAGAFGAGADSGGERA